MQEFKSNPSSTSLPYPNNSRSFNNLSLTRSPKRKALPCHIHYFVNIKSISYHQGRTYSKFDGLVLTLKFLSRPYTLEKTRKPFSLVQE
ncbi:hypothetical protein EV2_008723 [Malus domestica]